MSLRHPVCILTYIHAFIRVCICYVSLQCTEDRSDWLHHSSKSLKADIANTIQRVYLYGCVCEDRFDWLRLSSKSDFPRKMLHSQNTPIRVTQIPQYLAVQIQIKMLSWLNLYWAIWVSWHGGFWGCSILKSVVFWVESVIHQWVSDFMLFYLNLYCAIWISWHGGFRGCSILSGICHTSGSNGLQYSLKRKNESPNQHSHILWHLCQI